MAIKTIDTTLGIKDNLDFEAQIIMDIPQIQIKKSMPEQQYNIKFLTGYTKYNMHISAYSYLMAKNPTDESEYIEVCHKKYYIPAHNIVLIGIFNYIHAKEDCEVITSHKDLCIANLYF